MLTSFTSSKIQKRLINLSHNLQNLRENLKNYPAALFKTVFEVIRDYEVLTGYLYHLRAKAAPTDDLLLRLEDFMVSAFQELVSVRKPEPEISTDRIWLKEYRRVWRENISLFLFTAITFIASLFIGWQIIIIQPDLAPVFISQDMIENIIEKTPWFESAQQSPLMNGVLIAWNNIRVSFLCFTFAALLGIGGVLLLIYNGLYFGAVMAFCFLQGFDEQLSRFVLAHGVLELTIIVAGTFAGFLFGRVFYMRPYRLFSSRMFKAAREAGHVFAGVAPWLVIAAGIEVFISPWPTIPILYRAGTGMLAAVFFWLWTFAPVQTKNSGSLYLGRK